jgi:hypothetical protein
MRVFRKLTYLEVSLMGARMKLLSFLIACLLVAASNGALAAATVETAKAAKAVEAADAAVAEADAAADAAAKAEVAAKAAAEAAAKAAKDKEAAAKTAKEKAAAAKEQAKAAVVAATREGARACADWTQERAGKNKDGPASAWLAGYLAGIEVAKHQNFLKGQKKDALYKWVDEYCLSHPFEFTSDAGIQLYHDLARKKGLLD